MEYAYTIVIGNTGSHIRPFTNDLKRGTHMSINILLTLVEQYKEASQLIEAAQAEQEQLKIQIREALAELSTNYLEVGCHKVRLSDFSSTRLDSKSIKAVASDLYDQYSKTVTGTRLSITRKEPHTATYRPKFALYRALNHPPGRATPILYLSRPFYQ